MVGDTRESRSCNLFGVSMCTGAHVAQQLALLGVGQLVLVDHDTVEVANLNRLLGAAEADIGRPKVEVAARVVAAVQGGRPGGVVAVASSLLDLDPAELASSNLIVGCTDTHGSRAVLSELAAQYLIPLVDLGIEVQPGADGSRAGGGVRIVRPGDPCLFCMGIIDPAQVRTDLLSDEERARDEALGYLTTASVPAPSVVSLNGVVASLAVTEVLDLLLGLFPGRPRRLLYRAETRKLTTADVIADPHCYVCGRDGLLGLAGTRPLPRRVARPRSAGQECVR